MWRTFRFRQIHAYCLEEEEEDKASMSLMSSRGSNPSRRCIELKASKVVRLGQEVKISWRCLLSIAVQDLISNFSSVRLRPWFNRASIERFRSGSPSLIVKERRP